MLVAKYADHLPLYRQERIFGRAGLEIPRSTLAEWVGACGVQLQPLGDALRNTLLEHSVLHADETPVSMLAPGKKKTHKAYVWAYCTTPFSDLKATVYDFAPKRAGEHARTFLGDWQGKLVCDDYAGYKAGYWLFAGSLRSGQRAAAVMTLIQSAKLNGHDPYAYIKDVLTRLPTQKNSAIDELLPHNWKPAIPDKV